MYVWSATALARQTKRQIDRRRVADEHGPIPTDLHYGPHCLKGGNIRLRGKWRIP